LNATNSCAASALYMTNIFYQVTAEPQLKVFNTLSSSTFDSLPTNQTAYGLGIDSVNSRIFIGVTDYTSFGKVYVYDFYGAVLDSFDVHVSPGTFAFDVVNTTGLSQEAGKDQLICYPNPFSNELNLGYKGESQFSYSLRDVLGRELLTGQSVNQNSIINTSGFTPGIYLLEVITEKGKVIKKIAKQ
jgi:hypothetical protein